MSAGSFICEIIIVLLQHYKASNKPNKYWYAKLRESIREVNSFTRGLFYLWSIGKHASPDSITDCETKCWSCAITMHMLNKIVS